MRLIITRHGETEENKAGIIQGHLPGKLSEEGFAQAKKVALRLKDEKIDYIYSSDLARTSDTTREIMKFHPHVPVEFVRDLREKYLGDWQGRKKSDVGFSKVTSVLALDAKDAETSGELFDRAKKFLHTILTKHPKHTVLLAGHNAINKALVAVITNKTPEDIRTMPNFHNTSITIFEVGEHKKHRIIVYNCKKHLD